MELFNEHDLVVGNLEAVITDSEEKLPMHPLHLKTNKDHLTHLRNFDILSLANNHILDYLGKGLEDTIETLDDAEISHFGAGNDRSGANKPLIIRKGNTKLGFITFTRFANATSKKGGTADDRINRVIKDIRRLKREGCFVIVMPHWGYEHVPLPAPRQRSLAGKMIRNGADIVMGTHPHIHQGFELLQGKMVYYSLGNFVFSSKYFKAHNDWKLQKSAMVSIRIHNGFSYEYRLIPYLSTDNEVELLEGSEKEFVENDILRIRRILDSNYLKYAKMYFKDVGFIVDFGRKALSSQIRSGGQKSDFMQKAGKIIKIYSKADYQDVMNRFYRIFLFLLRRIDVSEFNPLIQKDEKAN